MKHLSVSSPSRGFTLIEVMVAVLVICIGMLGIAKMEALALSNSNNSRLRALAAIEAASLAAAMHANRDYWGKTPPQNVAVSPTASPVISSTDANLQTQAGNYLTTANLTALPASTACVGTSGGAAMCSTPANLAAFDVLNWYGSLKNLLPNPTASISCSGAPASCTIMITWGEHYMAMGGTGAGTGANTEKGGTGGAANLFATPTYMLYVEP